MSVSGGWCPSLSVSVELVIPIPVYRSIQTEIR